MPGVNFDFANKVSYANLDNIEETFDEYRKLRKDNKEAIIKQFDARNEEESCKQIGNYGLLTYANLTNAAFDYIVKNIFTPDDLLKPMTTCTCPLCHKLINNHDHPLMCDKMTGIHKRYHEIIVKLLITRMKPELGAKVC